jgi:hypothetical protein
MSYALIWSVKKLESAHTAPWWIECSIVSLWGTKRADHALVLCQGHLPLNPACCCSRSLKSMSWKFSDSSLSMQRSTCQKPILISSPGVVVNSNFQVLCLVGITVWVPTNGAECLGMPGNNRQSEVLHEAKTGYLEVYKLLYAVLIAFRKLRHTHKGHLGKCQQHIKMRGWSTREHEHELRGAGAPSPILTTVRSLYNWISICLVIVCYPWFLELQIFGFKTVQDWICLVTTGLVRCFLGPDESALSFPSLTPISPHTKRPCRHWLHLRAES